LTATEISSTATNLVWNVHPPSSTGTTISYFIERHQNNTGTFTHLATVGSVNDYVDNTRVSGYPYVYRVTALENGIPVAMSYPAKVTPMLFALFGPSWTSSIVTNVTSHLGKNDFGIHDFRISITNMFPAGIQKGLLYCSVNDTTKDSTTCLNNSEKQTRINAVGHGISYFIYDQETSNAEFTSPAIETQNPAYYTEKGASDVHSFGYKYMVAPTANDNGNCFANPVGTCGLLWKELRLVNWAHVDSLDLQFEGYVEISPLFVSDVQKVESWVYSNSSGHTLIMAQVLLPAGKTPTPMQMLPNLQAIKGMINGTDIECQSAGCNTTQTEIIFKGMNR
jgi:hypothetical protein